MADSRKIVTTEFKYEVNKASVDEAKRAAEQVAAAEAQLAENSRIAATEAQKAQETLAASMKMTIALAQQANQSQSQTSSQRQRIYIDDTRAIQDYLDSVRAEVPVLRTVQTATEGLGTALDDMGDGADRRIQALLDKFKGLNQEISAGIDFASDLRREMDQASLPEPSLGRFGAYDNLPDPSLSAFAAGGQQPTTRRRSSFSTLARGAGQILGATGQTELAGVVSQLATIGEAGKSAGVGLQTGLIATVALTAAIGFYVSQNQKASQSVKNLIATQEDYFRLLLTGTSEQIKARLDELRTEREITQARIAENREILRQFEEQVGAVGRAIFDVADTAGTRTLREETQKLETSLGSTELEMSRLEGTLGDAGVAARDAAEAEKQLAQARLDALDRQIQNQINLARLTRTGTSEGAQDRLAAIRDEQYANEAAIVSLRQRNDLTEEERIKLDELSEANARLNEEYGTIQNVILPAIIAREREADAIEAARKAQEGYVQSLEQTFDKLLSASEDIKDARRALTDAQSEGRARIDQIVQDSQDKRAEIEKSYEDSRTELISKAGDDRAKAESEYQKRLERIREEFETSREDAIQDRNAVALDKARRRADDETREADRRRQEQLNDVDNALRKQTQTVRTRYEEQLRTAQDAASKALQIEYQKYQQEINLRQQALDIALRQYADFVARLATISRQVAGQPVTTEPRAIPGRVTPTPYATGGYAPAGSVVKVNESRYGQEVGRDSSGNFVMFSRPMRVLSANEAQQMFKGTTNNLTFNVNGVGVKQIKAETRQQVINELDAILTDIGIA